MSWLRTIGWTLAAALAGVVLSVGWLAPVWGWVCWIPIFVLVWISRLELPRRAMWYGWVAGIGLHASAFYWLTQTLKDYSGFGPEISMSLHGLFCCAESIQLGLFCMLSAQLRRWNCRGTWIVALCWVTLEFAWPKVFLWRLADTMIEWSAIVQVAEWFGVHAVSFIIMWSAAAVTELAYRIVASKHDDASRAMEPWIALVVLAATICIGVQRLSSVERRMVDSPKISVAMVQPGEVNPDDGHEPARRLAPCRLLSRDIVEPVTLILWPESSVGAYPLDIESFTPEGLADVGVLPEARPFPNPPCHFLFGGTSVVMPVVDPQNPEFYNTAFLMDPSERLVGMYHKQALIPFGEYIPFQGLFPVLHGLWPFPGWLLAGTSAEPLNAANGARIGVLICYEDVVASLARETVKAGANILANLTNDYWFGTSMALDSHAQIARFRAIENRRSLLRCTMTGTTCAILPTGAVSKRLAIQNPEVLVAEVPLFEHITLYTRIGDLFPWSCVVVLILAFVFGWRRGRPHSGQVPEDHEARTS